MLSQKEKCIWDKLSEAAKATILGNAKAPHKPYTHVKFHGVTLGELIKASYHKRDFGETLNNTSNNGLIYEDHHTDNGGGTYMILTTLSRSYKVSRAYIRKLLSIPNSFYTQVMKELTIDVKLYHNFNTAFIYLFTHNHTHCKSLFDRGYNGGFYGEYVTVISISSHRHVNIIGIDNNDITSVTIAAVGTLYHSQDVPVIIIMHQYEYHGNGKTIYSYVQNSGIRMT